MMRKLLLAGVAALAVAGCGSAKIDAGQEGVVLKQPMFLGSGGVDPIPLKTGRAYIAWTTKVIKVNMQPIQQQVTFEDLMSSDGIPLHFDAVIRFRITDSVRLIKDYGPNWYANNLEAEFRNRVRQAVRKHGMNETAIDTTAIDAIDHEVTLAMLQYIKRSNLPIELLKITVGKANPPDAIKDQRIKTAEEQQRKLTMEQSQAAEEARLGAERARAQADNAYRQEMGLSPEQFVQIKQIDTISAVCRAGNCTFVSGGGTPIVDTRK